MYELFNKSTAKVIQSAKITKILSEKHLYGLFLCENNSVVASFYANKATLSKYKECVFCFNVLYCVPFICVTPVSE